MYAKLGFKNHDDGTRLLDHIRVNLGEGHEYGWTEFVNRVDQFLGDPHRTLFNELTLKDKIPLGLSGLDTPMDIDHEGNMCTIKNSKTSSKINRSNLRHVNWDQDSVETSAEANYQPSNQQNLPGHN